MKNACEITENLEIARAKGKLEVRREEYAKLLADYDELTSTVRRNLESEYMMRIGRLEYQLFSLQIEARQLKREIALYQAAKNRGETIAAEEVKTIIAREFAEYKALLAERLEKIRQAEAHHLAPKLSDADAKALRELYHDMVRKLHPDLNRTLPAGAERLWLRIVEAYKNCDWQELNILADMVYDLLDGGRIVPEELNAMERIAAEEQRIASNISKLRKRIRELRSKPPYSYQALLENKAAVNTKRSELIELRRRFEEYIAELTTLRDELCGGENA
jgi:hypothetical protein